MLIILAMIWLHNLKDQENKPLWLHLAEDLFFFLSKILCAAQKCKFFFAAAAAGS